MLLMVVVISSGCDGGDDDGDQMARGRVAVSWALPSYDAGGKGKWVVYDDASDYS